MYIWQYGHKAWKTYGLWPRAFAPPLSLASWAMADKRQAMRGILVADVDAGLQERHLPLGVCQLRRRAWGGKPHIIVHTALPEQL